MNLILITTKKKESLTLGLRQISIVYFDKTVLQQLNQICFSILARKIPHL